MCNKPISGRNLYFTLPVVIILTLCEVEVWSSACALCPAHSNSPVGSVAVGACRCDPGYSGPDGGACVECTAGSFKAGPGAGSCVACPTNSIPMVGSNSSTVCLCEQGYMEGAGGCVSCPTGFASKDPGTVCTACPGGVFSSADHTHCLCGPGVYGPKPDNGWFKGLVFNVHGICRDCLDRTFKHTTGPDACSVCPAH